MKLPSRVGLESPLELRPEALIQDAATAPPQFPRHQRRKSVLVVRTPWRSGADRTVIIHHRVGRKARQRVRRCGTAPDASIQI